MWLRQTDHDRTVPGCNSGLFWLYFFVKANSNHAETLVPSRVPPLWTWRKSVIGKAGSLAYRGWMAFARVLGIVNTTLLLTLVYFLLIGPLSLIMRAFGSDLLEKRMKTPSRPLWKAKAPLKHTLEECRHQF